MAQTQGNRLTIDWLAESRVRGNPHVRFGRRPGERNGRKTDTAPGRPHLASAVVDDVRRRVQQETTGHRGRRDDPLYRVRNILRAGQEHLSESQQARLHTAFTAREEHVEVEVAYRCAQQVRACFHQDSHAAGRRLAETVLTSLPTCPIPEVARLGRTLKRWREAFLGYFDTNGASNGGTEAVNGLIELHRAGPAAFATAKSRTSGNTERDSSQTHDGGHRSAPPQTGSPPPFWPPR